jgi:hypothetical protein
MRLLRRVALALLLSAAAGGAQDEERLPGWKGEVTRSTGAVKERWIEPIAWHPRAFLFHGFLSAAECEHIKDTARPRMERSMVRDGCGQLACNRAHTQDRDAGGGPRHGRREAGRYSHELR